MKRSELKGKAAVITGGSSGIGKATALELARQGVSLVLCARSQGDLDETARECQALGTQVATSTMDVTDEMRVKGVGDKAIQVFGRLDIWINNAGVDMFGRLEELPVEAIHRLVEVNLLGYIYGCRAALNHMRQSGKGTIINVSSLAGIAAFPYSSVYASTESGINALSASIRMENIDKPDITISTLIIPAIDTPFFAHSANYLGKQIRPFPPVYKPERVARTILRLTLRPRKEKVFGVPANMLVAMKRFFPFLTEKFIARMAAKHYLKAKTASNFSGNLYMPLREPKEVATAKQEALAVR